MTNSRAKGARGERELALKLREYGYESRRGQQYCGSNGDADVVGLPNIHIECKRTERLDLYGALAQAKADATAGLIPTVFHRKNNCRWVVVMDLEDFMKIYEQECANPEHLLPFEPESQDTEIINWGAEDRITGQEES